MAIHFACTCGKSYQARDEQAGKRTKCASCGHVLVIPHPTADPFLTDTIKGVCCADCGAMFLPHKITRVGGEALCQACREQRETAPEEITEIARSNLGLWLALGAVVLVLLVVVVYLVLH